MNKQKTLSQNKKSKQQTLSHILNDHIFLNDFSYFPQNIVDIENIEF